LLIGEQIPAAIFERVEFTRSYLSAGRFSWPSFSDFIRFERRISIAVWWVQAPVIKTADLVPWLIRRAGRC
jgi:hypothetical protein